MTVECVFGMLQKWFHILKSQVEYTFYKQVLIVLATCIVLNFVIDENCDPTNFLEDDNTTQEPSTNATSFNIHSTIEYMNPP